MSKKFGTFGGVFTPSLLTILGVIMYLRLPWIVGQSGLWLTIGIIIVAHIISITTGLSVASIATDKKVRTGGTYYIVSRSLGLPIGGTLGIGLFIGMSFGISLYLIGFSESFLTYWGLEASLNTIRLTGTIALVLLTVLTFISTSLAIRAQYFIMAAIALSLLSIFFGNNDFAPAAPLFKPAENSPSLIILFGIFFPSVTGFTTGVAMSGDLKDPKRSIPLGTMAAIIVGLFVYVGLAAFLAYRIDGDSLINNPNILLELSFFSPLVVVGIWGATLSSALGSILGGPRTLQAISQDHITPKFFGKGFGETNEPRNALLLSFVIAEAGILIGELNTIARIISMFFITTYGFLNLSCAIESWVSPDFRPSFKIPKSVSIIGAASCFLIMYELDFIGFISGITALGALFVYLKGKELTLETGDTLEGVWSTIIRSGLNRLHQTKTHQRNWRPNIILFSGGEDARPHLIELGRWLTYKRGMLSNFDLHETHDAKVLFEKRQQTIALNNNGDSQSIFTRRLECRNIYEGMETIARVYGFSGIDPNTVMMGWARNTHDPQHFAQTIKQLQELEHNVLLLDYDEEKGFGTRTQIDIWWRGGSNNATLALTMLKFLKVSREWQEAEARILIVIDDSALANKVHRNMHRLLEDERIDATVKVINNAIEKRSFDEIITMESSYADLTMIGIPEINEKNSDHFVHRINSTVNGLNTTLLLHASNFFEPIYIGIERKTTSEAVSDYATLINVSLPQLKLPAYDLLAYHLTQLNDHIEKILNEYDRAYLQNVTGLSYELLDKLKKLFKNSFDTLEKKNFNNEAPRYQKALARVQSDYLYHSHSLLDQFKQNKITLQKDELVKGHESLFFQMDSIWQNIPDEIVVHYQPGNIEVQIGDSFSLRCLKFWKRIQLHLFKKPVDVRLSLKSLAQYYFKKDLEKSVYAHLESFGITNYRLLSDLQNCLNSVKDSFGMIQKSQLQNKLTIEIIHHERKVADTLLADIKKAMQNQYEQDRISLLSRSRQIMQIICDESVGLDVNQRVKKNRKTFSASLQWQEKIVEIPDLWTRNQTLLLSFTLMDISLLIFQNRIETIIRKLKTELKLSIESTACDKLTKLHGELQTYRSKLEADPSFRMQLNFEQYHGTDCQGVLTELLADVHSAITQLPEEFEILSEEAFQQIIDQQYNNEIQTRTISLRRLVDYQFETEFIEIFKKELNSLSKQLQESITSGRDIVRLVRFSLTVHGDEKDESIHQGLHEAPIEIIKTNVEQISDELQRVQGIPQKVNELIDQQIKIIFDKLTPYMVVRLAASLGWNLRTDESRKMISDVEARGKRAKNLLNKALVHLQYRKSEGILLARRFSEIESQPKNCVSALLDLVEMVSPRSATLKVLPFYYRQLFLSQQTLNKEFWVKRPIAMEQAEIIINRYRQGFYGGLLVTGDPGSGKTSLCQTIVRHFFKEQKVYHLFPPDGGSVVCEEFKKRLQEAVELNGDYDKIFNVLSQKSVIIINDLQMWWERSRGSFKAIDEIIQLIESYSDRCFFIVNTDTHSFSFIKRNKNIENAFIGTIDCKPFSARELQRAILLRHHSSGLKFDLDDQEEEQLSKMKRARLFSKYFNYSDGNIGTALRAWISHIDSFTSNRLMIGMPQKPELDSIERLEAESLEVLRQIIIHKQVTIERLVRILRSDADKTEQRLSVLKRTGLIVSRREETVEANPYLQTFIVQKFYDIEIL